MSKVDTNWFYRHPRAYNPLLGSQFQDYVNQNIPLPTKKVIKNFFKPTSSITNTVIPNLPRPDFKANVTEVIKVLNDSPLIKFVNTESSQLSHPWLNKTTHALNGHSIYQ